MTISQLHDIGNNWMDRTIRLALVWRNESLPMEKRERAFRLWQTMSGRVMACFQKLSEYHQKQNSRIASKLPIGGVWGDLRFGAEIKGRK